MRHSIRWALNGAALGSAVLCVAVCVLWARNCFVEEDSVYVHTKESRIRIDSSDGSLVIAGFPAAAEDGTKPWITFYFGSDDYELRYFGIMHSEADGRCGDMWEAGPGAYGFWNIGFRLTKNWIGARPVVSVPYWLLLVLLGILPARKVLRLLRRRRRARAGQCALCGYDLRATRSRCPECGTAPKARAS
jgi:hypothetical protein